MHAQAQEALYAHATRKASMSGEQGAIKKDGFDVFAYDQALQQLPDLEALEAEGFEKNGAWPHLMEDVYAALYKSAPKEDEESDAPEAHRTLIRQLMESLDYDQLRATTKLSRTGSAFGALELGEDLLGKIPAGEPQRDPNDPDDKGWQFLEGCDSEADQGRVVRRAMRQARKRTEEVVETMQALGAGSGEGTGGGSDLQAAAKIARSLRSNDKLRKIAALAGRMRRIATSKKRTRAKRKPDEVVGIETGRDIARAIPSDLALLGTAMRDTVLLRWAQGQILQYELEGTEQLSKGPIVVCIDSSYSMHGERDTWAKAVALGLLSIAQREKRAFSVILFAGAGSIQTFKFGTKASMDKVLDCLSKFLGGGTDFETPLDEALSLIHKTPLHKENKSMREADVVMITDGDCRIAPGFESVWRRQANAIGAQLYTIYVGTNGESLNAISDGVARISRLDQDAEALDLVFGI